MVAIISDVSTGRELFVVPPVCTRSLSTTPPRIGVALASEVVSSTALVVVSVVLDAGSACVVVCWVVVVVLWSADEHPTIVSIANAMTSILARIVADIGDGRK
jgi:hypothetical protein